MSRTIYVDDSPIKEGDVIKFLGKRHPPMIDTMGKYYFQCELNGKHYYISVNFFSRVENFYCLVVDRAVFDKKNLRDKWLYLMYRKFVVKRIIMHTRPLFINGSKTEKSYPVKQYRLKHLYK